MNVGFDLDKIFINTPPIVPQKVIEWLYKGKQDNLLKYRRPKKTEQLIRIISHHSFLRPLITENFNFIKKQSSVSENKYYIISSRFSFLKKKTDQLIRRYGFNKLFNGLYFNYADKQPHEFKNEMLNKLKIDRFIDDDLPLLEYLAGKNPKTRFYWLNRLFNKPLKKNLIAIKHISEMLK